MAGDLKRRTMLRAGPRTATYFGNNLSSFQANVRGNKPYNGASLGPVLAHTERVGAYPANAWGLHDMHGNVFNWRRDWFHTRYRGGVDPDPGAPMTALRAMAVAACRARAAADAGPTKDGPAGRASGCVTSRKGGQTLSA
jgi:formylglycine-generating enzyme required for sulfatase activity